MKKIIRELLGFIVFFFSHLTFLETVGAELYISAILSLSTSILGLWLLLAGKEE